MNITKLKQRFKSSIKRGTGETYLIMQSYPTIDFSDSIIMASLKNFAYDGQTEGSRAEYIFELISLSGQREKIRNAILKGLAVGERDTWSLVQLFDLAKLFAKQGDQEARQAIYNRFFKIHPHRADWAGYNDILELDGIDGLIFIAEKIGNALEKHPDDWQDDHIISYFQQNNLEINVMQIVEEASAHNQFIKTYLSYVKRSIEDGAQHKADKVVYKDAIDEILLSKGRFQPLRKRNDSDLLLIAQRFLTEKNKINRERLLMVFIKNKFPFDSQIILDLSIEKSKRRSKISKTAIDALALLKSDNIRDFAIDQILSNKNPESYTGILKSNYKKGDGKLLTDIAKSFKSEFKIESLVYDYVAIYDANNTEECRKPLEVLYEKSNCGIHRESIVTLLIENNVISEKIRAEIPFDSNDAVRKLIEHI